MLAIDTNLIVRFLTLDHPSQSRRALEIVASNDVFVSVTVLLESEWVLRDAYDLPRDEVVRELKRFCDLERVKLGARKTVQRAFEYAGAGLDFADAFHLAQDEGCEAFMTFDKRMAKRAQLIDCMQVRLA